MREKLKQVMTLKKLHIFMMQNRTLIRIFMTHCNYYLLDLYMPFDVISYSVNG